MEQSPPPASGTGPQISALTAANLAQHSAALIQKPPATLDTLDVTTLGYSDPEARRQAYLERKQARNKGRKQPHLPGSVSDSLAPGAPADRPFLSKVHEVEADVQYRFNFVLVGPGTVVDQVAALACNSAAAEQLGGNAEESANPERPVSHHSGSPKAIAQRCLCAITPSCGEKGTEKQRPQKLAKLVFDTVDFGTTRSAKLPSCSNRLEALSTAMVFVLVIDGPHGRKGGFARQLRSLTSMVERNRRETHAKFRPVRAVILAHAEASQMEDATPAAQKCQADSWLQQWAQFEQEQGDTWKFGPVALHDGDALHAAFAEMAATRISEGRCTATACDPVNEADEEEAVKLERQLLEQHLQEKGAGATVRAVSRALSEHSEGWQQPPVFDAEVDGSACSEGALEAYAALHGLEREKLVQSQDFNKDFDWEFERFDNVCAHPQALPTLEGESSHKGGHDRHECGSFARRVCVVS